MALEGYEKAKNVKERYTDKLFQYPNVTGVGVGYKERGGKTQETICIRVYVSKKLPRDALKVDALLPSSIEGVPVDVLGGSDFKAL